MLLIGYLRAILPRRRLNGADCATTNSLPGRPAMTVAGGPILCHLTSSSHDDSRAISQPALEPAIEVFERSVRSDGKDADGVIGREWPGFGWRAFALENAKRDTEFGIEE